MSVDLLNTLVPLVVTAVIREGWQLYSNKQKDSELLEEIIDLVNIYY